MAGELHSTGVRAGRGLGPRHPAGILVLAESLVGRLCASSGGRSAAASGRRRIASASDAESASLSVAASEALLLLVSLAASASWSSWVVVVHVDGHVYLRKHGMQVVIVRSRCRRFHSCSSRLLICSSLGSQPHPTAFLYTVNRWALCVVPLGLTLIAGVSGPSALVGALSAGVRPSALLAAGIHAVGFLGGDPFLELEVSCGVHGFLSLRLSAPVAAVSSMWRL